MKHVLIASILMLVSAFGASAQSDFYKKCKRSNLYEMVYISKGMLNLVSESSLNVNDMDFSKLIRKIDSIAIISTDKKPYCQWLGSDANNTFRQGKNEYSLLLEVTEGDEHVIILEKTEKGGSTHYVLLLSEKDSMTVIEIEGVLTAKDIMSLKTKKK